MAVLIAVLSLPVHGQGFPVFHYGQEPVIVPSEMKAVIRIWHPSNAPSKQWGIKRGEPFEAALVRVFEEKNEIAVFRFRDRSVRAWRSDSFSEEDRILMKEMKAKAPKPPIDQRVWTTSLGPKTQKAVDDGTAFKHETQHFAFLWGNELKSSDFIKKAGEWFELVWDANEVDFKAPMPYAGDPKPKRIIVSLYGTGLPGVGKGYANSAKSMAIDPTAMRWGSTVVSHEFTHVVHAYTGGYMVRSSGGPMWEAFAEAGSFNFSPTQAERLHEMLKNLNFGCQWPDSRYSNFAYIIHLWEKKRTHHLVYDIWTKNRRDKNGASEEDQIETIARIGMADGSLPLGLESFNEEIGEMGARLVTMDYINQGFLLEGTVEARKKFKSRVVASPTVSGWFDSPPDKKLYPYGVHWIAVAPDPGSRQVTVSFRGNSEAPDAKWRVTLVAVDKNNFARYSPRVPMTGGTEGKVSMDVKPGEDYVLVVAATPLKYRPLTWGKIPEFDFPYLVRASGGKLAVAEDKPLKK